MEFIALALIVLGAVWGGRTSKKADLPKLEISAGLNPGGSEKFSGQKLEKLNTKGEKQKSLSELARLPIFWGSDGGNLAPVRIPNKADLEILASSAIAMDMETGDILFQKNQNEKLPIASISKIFTALAAYDKGDLKKTVVISKKAVETESSAGDLEVGEKIKLKDLISLMLVSSSNDAAVQVSLEISNSTKEFGALMTEKAKELGLKKSVFAEPSGLSDSNLSTVLEIAQTARMTFGKTPVWDILKNKEIGITSLEGKVHHLKNTNEIISENYILSGKTGYTAKAKGTLAIIADSGQNNRKIIAVILGSDDRFGEMKKLVEWTRNSYFFSL